MVRRSGRSLLPTGSLHEPDPSSTLDPGILAFSPRPGSLNSGLRPSFPFRPFPIVSLVAPRTSRAGPQDPPLQRCFHLALTVLQTYGGPSKLGPCECHLGTLSEVCR